MAWYPSFKHEVPPLAIVEWASGTDEEIAAMLEAHYAGQIDIHDYWTAGDERVVSLSAMSAMSPLTDTHAAQSVVMALSEVGGKYLSDGVTECAFQVDQKDSLNEAGYLNYGQTNTGGWKESQRRTWCNSIYKAAFPSTLVGIFKEFINQSGLGGGSSSGVENTIDTFALRAEIEVSNTCYYSVSGEGTQIEYYKTGIHKMKKVNGSMSPWWLRSPYNSSYPYFCDITNGSPTCDYPNNSFGLAPFGCI